MNFKVEIKNLETSIITHWQYFVTESAALSWVSEVESKGVNPWGHLERVIYTYEATEWEFNNAIEIIEPEYYENDTLIHPERIRAPKTYEVIIQDLTLENTARIQIEEDIRRGEEDQEKCSRALKYIGGYNRRNLLTSEQITSMQTTFGNIFSMLLANRPDMAITLIEEITPDEVIVTSELKNNVLGLLYGPGIN